jgi:CrcB protein
MAWLLVGLGGAVGSLARYGTIRLVSHSRAFETFPFAVFIVNFTGSIAIGVLAGLSASGRFSLSDEVRALLFVGVLGGFTTFSSFSLDTLTLLRDGHGWQAIVNVVGQVVLGLAGAWLGYRLATG